MTTSPQLLLAHGLRSGGLWLLRLVSLDYGQPVRLLPGRWFTSSILPVISCATRAAKLLHDVGGGEVGKVILEAHNDSLAGNQKSAMPKITFAKVGNADIITGMDPTTKQPSVTSTFDYGRAAALRGCFRILVCPDSPAQEQEWLAGFDSVPRENRGKWPRHGPVLASLAHLANHNKTMTHQTDTESPQPVAEEKDLVGVATHDLLAVLVALPEDERNAAYVEANSWQWPTALEQYKEGRFDVMRSREKMKDPAWKALWSAIHQCTSEFGRSQGWWLIELKRTREDHAAWWANGQRPVSSAND